MATNRPLKVYGWQGWRNECEAKQTREIVAARSLAEVLRITDSRRSDLFNICETGNDNEIAIAMASPGTVFWRPLDCYGGGDWTRVVR